MALIPELHLLPEGSVIFCGRDRSCAGIEGIERIRLSSIELTDLSKSLREAFGASRSFARIFIFLFKARYEILSKMNRSYYAGRIPGIRCWN